MTLNGVVALVLRYSTEFDRLGGRLRHSGWRETYEVWCRISSSSYILAKTDPRSSRTVSLRQPSFLLNWPSHLPNSVE